MPKLCKDCQHSDLERYEPDEQELYISGRLRGNYYCNIANVKNASRVGCGYERLSGECGKEGRHFNVKA